MPFSPMKIGHQVGVVSPARRYSVSETKVRRCCDAENNRKDQADDTCYYP